MLASIFIARRIQPSLSLTWSTVKSNFVYRRINRSPLFVRYDFLFLFFFREENSRANVRRFRSYQLNHRGCFSHSTYWLSTRKTTTRWPIPLVVCCTGKRAQKKKESSSAPPSIPPRCSFRDKKKHAQRIYRCYAGFGPPRVRTRIPSIRRLG